MAAVAAAAARHRDGRRLAGARRDCPRLGLLDHLGRIDRDAGRGLQLARQPGEIGLLVVAEGVGPVADLEEQGEAGGRLDVRHPDREDRLEQAERHLDLGPDIRRFVRLVGDEDDEGAALLDRLLQLLGIILAGADVARRDPGLGALRLDEGRELVRLDAVVRSMADENVAVHALPLRADDGGAASPCPAIW